MNNPLVARILSAIFFAISAGVIVDADYHKWSVLGKEAFMTNEATRFDHYMAHPSSFMPIGMTLFAFMMVAAYEWLSLGICKVLSLVWKPKNS